jgi:hypothetical protein
MSDHPESGWPRLEAVRRARAVLAGELGVLEGCVELAAIADGVVPAWFDDPDFSVFGAVASEADDIPLGAARQQWQGEALTRRNALASEYSARVRDQVLRACESVIARFSADQASR